MLTHKMFWLEFIITGDAMVAWSTPWFLYNFGIVHQYTTYKGLQLE